MAWWRRDPSLWARTPIHRYTRRTLRDHEATLRARCFSKSNLKAAQHKDDDDNRPGGMSNLEWMQLQHYRRWKRRFEENPYRALFGASEDMLNGKGLKDWDWVYRTFPKWMVREMGLTEKEQENSKPASSPKSSEKKPNKPDSKQTEEDKNSVRRASEPLFPAPSFRSTRFEKDLWQSGVESPSDSRRPLDNPIPKTINKTLNSKETLGGQEMDWTPKVSQEQEVNPVKDSYSSTRPNAPTSRIKNAEMSGKEAIARETSFIEEFLADTSQSRRPTSIDEAKGAGWRQTVIERRALPGFIPKPRRSSNLPITDVTVEASPIIEPNHDQIPDPDPITQTSSALQSDRVTRHELNRDKELANEEVGCNESPEQLEPTDTHREVGEEWLIESTKISEQVTNEPPKVDASHSRKSTSEILDQLPKDDIDFLSAEDIRASMGSKRSDQEDRNETRQRLEKEFDAVHKKDWQLDSMLESRILNDQHVRRTERELLQAQKETGAYQETSSSANSLVGENAEVGLQRQLGTSHDSNQNLPIMETSLDSMSRWLHTGGNIFAANFWQDPVQILTDQEKTKRALMDDPFLKGIRKGVKKGSSAMSLIKDELIQDLPDCRSLVQRLTSNEENLVAFIDTASISPTQNSLLSVDKATARQRVHLLRRDLLKTDESFKQACKAIGTIHVSNGVAEAQKRKLRTAADILEKNLKLTRMMVFALQTRLESLNQKVGDHDSPYLNILHQLLALQDTQLAISRAVARAMQVYGIRPEVEKDDSEKHATSPSSNASIMPELHGPIEGPSIAVDKKDGAKRNIHDAAANSLLQEEIGAQKAAMRGLSDDGYTRSPKTVKRKSYDEPNPLAHSLFRPFGSQLESLGKDVEVGKEASDTSARVKADKELVREVKNAYEDVYGPITTDHRQVPINENKGVSQDTKRMEMSMDRQPKDWYMARKMKSTPIQLLKEDRISSEMSSIESSAITPETSTSESDVKTHLLETPEYTSSDFSESSSIPPSTTPSSTSSVDDGVATALSSVKQPERPDSSDHRTPELEADPAETREPFNVKGGYQIITYDAQADEVLITTPRNFHISASASQTDETLPLHEALATLSNPSKFLPHIPNGSEIITARPHMLVLRSAPAGSTSIEFHTARIPASPEVESRDEGWKGINPIDGTTRLSPTGYVGDGLELEREFQERRAAAGEYHGRTAVREREESRKSEKRNQAGKGKVGLGGVMKTAIIAGAWCYVAGVIAELMKYNG